MEIVGEFKSKRGKSVSTRVLGGTFALRTIKFDDKKPENEAHGLVG